MATEQSKENLMSDIKQGCVMFAKLIDLLQKLKLVELWWKNDEREEYVKRYINIQK